MAKIMPLKDLLASTQTQLDDAELHANTMAGGVENLKSLLQQMVKDRRVLKEMRKQCSRMGVSSRYVSNLLKEQLFEMEQVRARKEGIEAQMHQARTYAWEYKSILEHFSDYDNMVKKLTKED